MRSLQYAILALVFSLVASEINSTDVSDLVKEVEKEENNIMEKIVNEIQNHKVMLYSKTYCPFSKRIKALLSKYEISDMEILELDKQPEMKQMQIALKKISGRSTVPQLFVDGEFIGGCDDTKALDAKGKLKPILEKAHALRR